MLTKEEVINLDSGAKYDIWLHYLLVQLSLKHNFHVRDIHPTKLTESNTKGWGKADKTFGNIELRYLWKDLKYFSFDEYTDEMLWEWYWRFADEIQLKNGLSSINSLTVV